MASFLPQVNYIARNYVILIENRGKLPKIYGRRVGYGGGQVRRALGGGVHNLDLILGIRVDSC